MEWWQLLVLLALTPSIVLNYGFDNFAVGAGGFKFPLSDLLMFLALASWLGESVERPQNILIDPPVACLMALLVMTFFHLLIDVPRYGFYAVRDGSMFFESVILILGVTWAQDPRNTELLKRWLFYVFLANLFYSYTFIWGEKYNPCRPVLASFIRFRCSGTINRALCWLLLGAMYFVWIAPSVGSLAALAFDAAVRGSTGWFGDSAGAVHVCRNRPHSSGFVSFPRKQEAGRLCFDSRMGRCGTAAICLW